MRLLSLLLHSSALLGASAITCSDYGPGWSNTTLDPSIGYVAYHKVVGSTLHLRLIGLTQGWLGFGIAEPTSGHMKGSDLLTVAVVGGTVVADDRYAVFAPTTYNADGTFQNGYMGLDAVKDTSNDWTIVQGSEANGVTDVYVTRELDTGDTQDRVIASGLNRIVWAYSTTTDGVAYHGSTRGSTSAVFFGAATASEIPAHDGYWDRTFSNYEIPTQGTTYACQSFTLPTDKNRHIVAFRPLQVTKYNHHAILHVCTQNTYFNQHAMPNTCSSGGLNTGVGSSPLGSSSSGCSGLMWAWAVGQGDFIVPAEAGLRISSNGGNSKVILEIHYDNPEQKSGIVDSIGFRAYYTETLRTHDAGMMIMADGIVGFDNSMTVPNGFPSGPLPAGQASIHRTATCPSACTTDLSQPITVFSTFHHMHYHGHKMYNERYPSGGSAWEPIGQRIDFWDNGYQQNLVTPYTINPGDAIQTHCYFDTRGVPSTVNFGSATSNEMCMDFIMYYPVQYRGQNANGDAEPFSFCSLMHDSGIANTLCGSLSQAGTHSGGVPNFMLGGQQQARSGDATKADPLGFGIANRAVLNVASTPACVRPTEELSPGAIAGIVVGSVLGPVVLGAIVFMVCKARQKRRVAARADEKLKDPASISEPRHPAADGADGAKVDA